MWILQAYSNGRSLARRGVGMMVSRRRNQFPCYSGLQLVFASSLVLLEFFEGWTSSIGYCVHDIVHPGAAINAQPAIAKKGRWRRRSTLTGQGKLRRDPFSAGLSAEEAPGGGCDWPPPSQDVIKLAWLRGYSRLLFQTLRACANLCLL
jgi:hypothetical protein